MFSHFLLLVSQDAESRTRFPSAEQYETGVSILGIVTGRVGLVDLAAIEQTSGAGEASSLMAEGGQLDARGQGGIPNVLVGADGDGALSVRQ